MRRLDCKTPQRFEWINNLANSLLRQEARQRTDSFSDKLNEFCERLEAVWMSIATEFNE